ncbi:hypothetical protein Lser_V15G04707 [Lactuca serriola]
MNNTVVDFPENNCSSRKDNDKDDDLDKNAMDTADKPKKKRKNPMDSADKPKKKRKNPMDEPKKKRKNPMDEPKKKRNNRMTENSLEEENGKRREPIMSERDFRAKYPRTDAGLNEIELFEDLTRDEKKMMRKCMVYNSEKELDHMEDEWNEYHLEEIRRTKKRVHLFHKQSQLIQKAITSMRSAAAEQEEDQSEGE